MAIIPIKKRKVIMTSEGKLRMTKSALHRLIESTRSTLLEDRIDTELDHLKKNIANARLGGWVKPAMVAIGHFKKAAGVEEPVVLIEAPVAVLIKSIPSTGYVPERS